MPKAVPRRFLARLWGSAAPASRPSTGQKRTLWFAQKCAIAIAITPDTAIGMPSSMGHKRARATAEQTAIAGHCRRWMRHVAAVSRSPKHAKAHCWLPVCLSACTPGCLAYQCIPFFQNASVGLLLQLVCNGPITSLYRRHCVWRFLKPESKTGRNGNV